MSIIGLSIQHPRRLLDYSSSSTGGGIRFGFPIGEKESIGLGLGLDSTSIKTYEQTPQYYKDFVTRFGDTNISVPLTPELGQ